MAEMTAIKVGRWNLGLIPADKTRILMLQFTDREPINLAIPSDEAIKMARAILEQENNPPPRRDQMS